MEVKSSAKNGTAEENRRKSGRVSRRPDLFIEEQHDRSILSNASTKRKRNLSTYDAGATDDDEESESESASNSESGQDSGDEHYKGAQSTKSKPKTARRTAPKPAVKRPKTGKSPGTTLTIRSANIQNKTVSKAAKVQKARARPSQINREGLYAQVFGYGNSAEDAASVWMQSLEKDSVAAIRDIVNFILECIDCEVEVSTDDIEDLDNVPNRLGDILEEYAQKKDAEYPLISKTKQYIGFRDVLVQFFAAIIKALHASSILYNQPEVYDNIHVWVATMSGAGYRSFRHTATVISLTMTTALCEIAQEIQSSIAATRTQLETEKKKKSVNKGRVNSLQDNLKMEEGKLEAVDAQLRDAFDTVYVHRYRDVDEKIRVECVNTLGNWITLYRKMFLEGQYLRYLGWVLSDPNSPTRLEVIKQLKMLFKSQRNVAALRAFTERFRSRIVEMGTRDADVSVRVETIELLNRLRNAELLEPDDIDTVGRLIFDAEPRVRKAIARFFVSNIEDLYKASIEDVDAEQYAAALPTAEKNDDFMSAEQSWIKFKSLAQTLGGYDRDVESEHGLDKDHTGLDAAEVDSRYILATQSIYQHMPELQKWEALAGYLLCDHSSINCEPDDADINLAVQGAYKLNAGEEIVLLDVLYCSTKLYLQSIVELQPEKKGRKTNATRDEIRERQESAAHNLIVIIPQLLNKFGTLPQAATSILRLEQLLDIDLINDLQSGEGTYSSLLDDINKQFVSHSDRKVLAEASKAFRTARTFDQSKEATDAKVTEIWHDATTTLGNLLRGKSIESRGTLDRNVLGETMNICTRLASLASVSDCTENLESHIPAAANKRKSKGSKEQSLLEVLLELLNRGVPDEETTATFAEIEDQLCVAVVAILSLYFRWKIVALKNAVELNIAKSLATGTLVNFAMQRTAFVEVLIPIVQARLPLDPVRINCILTLLDLHTLFATLRHAKPSKGTLDDGVKQNLNSLVTDLPPQLVTELMSTHSKMEKSLAKKTNRKIESNDSKTPNIAKAVQEGTVEDEREEDIEKPPEDSDDDDEDVRSDEEEESDLEADGEEAAPRNSNREAKRQAALLAEQQLCELTSKIVLAIIAGVLSSKIKYRLQTNRTKLGKSYGQVIAYLDDEKKKAKTSKKVPSAAAGVASEAEEARQKSSAKPALSEAMVIEGDDIEDDEDGDGGDEEREIEDEIEDGEEDEDDDDAAADPTGRAAGDQDDIMGD